jgi:TadE-like protein
VAVEAALVLPLLFTLMFGIIELSMLVRDNIAVASAARVGVRAATTTAAVMSGPGNCSYADPTAGAVCAVDNNPAPGLAELAADAIAASGSSMNKDTIDYILVYQANEQGYPGSASTMPGSCSGHVNCVKLVWSEDASAFRFLNGSWKSTSVNACAGQSDAVGVYLHITHEFLTGLFPDSIGLSDRAVGRFEPLPPDNCKSTSPFPHP